MACVCDMACHARHALTQYLCTVCKLNRGSGITMLETVLVWRFGLSAPPPPLAKERWSPPTPSGACKPSWVPRGTVKSP
jgi:hypothetical protein